MTAGGRIRALAAVACGLAGGLQAGAARAYTFVEEVPEDACTQARSFDPQDASQAAQHARRACRLDTFSQMMADRRREQVAAQQEARDTLVQKWVAGTLPGRVINPMAVELFAGSGIINYGAAFSWDVLSHLELAAHIGQRQMSCATMSSNSGADCTRTTWSVGARWIVLDRDFSPFLGAAFSSTKAPLKINHYNAQAMTTEFLNGNGRADSGSASAGVQLAVSQVRLSVEYIFEYAFYTGANLGPDMMDRPSEDLRSVWKDSLDQDRHGVRFQVGFAF